MGASKGKEYTLLCIFKTGNLEQANFCFYLRDVLSMKKL